MKKTIEIPEGYEARIEGNKVILEPKECEDERIRKELLEVIRHCYEDGGYTLCTDDYKNYLAYLEKQKDEAQKQFNLGIQTGREEVLYEMEKEPHYSPLCNTIKDKIREYIANHFIADRVVKTDMKSIVKAMEEGVRLGKEEQKPAEWSKEDETNLNNCICSLHQYGYMTYADFLKHLPERFNLQPKQSGVRNAP